MSELKIAIRHEKEGDYPIITLVNDLAFGQKNEGQLVEKLRRTEKFIPELSLVAVIKNKIVGHILFYPVSIKTKSSTYPTLSLAPMAVIPEFQNRKIGSRLVIEGLKKAKALGYRSVIVLGHPEYYPRFGFQPASKWHIHGPFDAPDNCFMAIELVPGELEGKGGIVEYPEAYHQV